MPEINKNYNTEEHKILCMNGQKEYCPKDKKKKKEHNPELEISCEEKIEILIQPSNSTLSYPGRCSGIPFSKTDSGIAKVYVKPKLEYSPTQETYIEHMIMFLDCNSQTPISFLPDYPNMVSFYAVSDCYAFNYNSELGGFVQELEEFVIKVDN